MQEGGVEVLEHGLRHDAEKEARLISHDIEQLGVRIYIVSESFEHLLHFLIDNGLH